MRAFVTAQVRPFLVISSVLAVWLLLAAPPAQAHDKGARLPTPSCSSLPNAAFFGASETLPILSDTIDTSTETLTTKRGTDVSGSGKLQYHYAKITIPALAAGELRVFDSRTAAADTLSDAVLCRKGRQIAQYRKSYTSHDNAITAATNALNAAKAATASEAAAAAETDADEAAKDRRAALRTARDKLLAAERDLRAIGATTNANDARDNANAANSAAAGAATALSQALTDAAGDLASVSADTTTLSDLSPATTTGTAAADALLGAANNVHSVFQLRAPVSPGDEEYIVVVALPNVAAVGLPKQATATGFSLHVAFHGAITTTTKSLENTLRANIADSYTIRVTASGLLTLQTTGSTDTTGSLRLSNADATDPDTAKADSGGRGGNFKMVVPVRENASGVTYTVLVGGQTSTTAGAYTLGMDFEVVMDSYNIVQAGSSTLGEPAGASPTWDTPDTPFADDSTPWQIKKIAEHGSIVDEDYILLSVAAAAQGFLTVEAKDDSDSATKNADTTGTLYGPMGQIDMATGGGGGTIFG